MTLHYTTLHCFTILRVDQVRQLSPVNRQMLTAPAHSLIHSFILCYEEGRGLTWKEEDEKRTDKNNGKRKWGKCASYGPMSFKDEENIVFFVIKVLSFFSFCFPGSGLFVIGAPSYLILLLGFFFVFLFCFLFCSSFYLWHCVVRGRVEDGDAIV